MELYLPEFAFVEGSGHESPNVLERRNVIIHTCTMSIMEVFDRDGVLLNDDVPRFKFYNKNKYGIREPMVIALHRTAIPRGEGKEAGNVIKEVLKAGAKWYCDYCDWEDCQD